MAVTSERPYGSFNFRVSLGEGAKASTGFSEVVFPVFALSVARGDPPAAAAPATLVLRRGFDGALDVYSWWNKSRRSKRARGRTVTVELLDESQRRPVARWKFTGCRPVSLAYSPLDARSSAVLIETVELSYEDIEMA